MDAAVVGVLGTLLGGLVGGLLTHWNSSALAKRDRIWQQVRLRQEKLEEIAGLVDRIQQHFEAHMLEIVAKMFNKPFEEVRDRVPLERLRILIEFYAPSLLSEWENLERARGRFGDVLIDALSGKEQTKQEQKELFRRITTAEDHIAMACRSLSEKAADLAREAVVTHTTRVHWRS